MTKTKIIVFAKGLKITKMDETFEHVLTGATFELYRTARTGETGAPLEGVTGSYTKVADLDASEDGYATLEHVKGLKSGETYYLVEKDAPEGCLKLDHPVKVNLNITNHYYPAGSGLTYMRNNEGESTHGQGLYDWAQKATLTLDEDTAVRRTNNDGTIDLTHEGIDEDFSVELMFYSIANGSGAELPAAGARVQWHCTWLVWC